MQLPKIKTLGRVLKLVYTTKPVLAILRDIAAVAGVALEIYLITLGGKFIDATGQILLNFNTFTLKDFFFSDSFFYLALSVGIWLSYNALDRLAGNLKESIREHIQFEMETKYFDKVSKENMEDVEGKEFRDLMAFVKSYSFTGVYETYRLFTDISQDIAMVVTSIIMLFTHVGPLALLLVVFAIPEAVCGYYHRNKLVKYREQQVERTKWIDYVMNLMTRIQYFPEMRVDDSFSNLKKEYNTKAETFMENIVTKVMHLRIDTTLFSTISRVLLMIYIVSLIAISVVKKYTIGTFKAMYDYAVTVFQSSFDALNRMFIITDNLKYAAKYFEYEDFVGFGDEEPGDKKLPKGVPDLELYNLDFTYPKEETKIVENINLKVKAGEKIMIIGKDGSGKSTLVKLLCGLYKITAGDYMIGEYSIKELARGELKKKIAVLFQDFINYNLSLKRNITLCDDKTKVNESRYEEAKKLAGVDKMMKIFNVSENQMLGKYISNGVEISPGFWQRIALARIIYRNREIIILDEPFTFIDDEEEDKIIKDLFSLWKEKTVIYISREKRHTKRFERVYVLDKGKLKEYKK